MSEIERLQQLFITYPGAGMVSAMFNDKWLLSEPVGYALDYEKGSWLHRCLGDYLYHMARTHALPILQYKYEMLESKEMAMVEACYEDASQYGILTAYPPNREYEKLNKRMCQLEEVIHFLKTKVEVYNPNSLERLGYDSLFEFDRSVKPTVNDKLLRLDHEQKAEYLISRNT